MLSGSEQLGEAVVQGALSSCWQALREGAARPVLWRDLAAAYQHAGLHWQAGYATRQALRLDPGMAPLAQPQLQQQPPTPATRADSLTTDAVLGAASLEGAARIADTFAAWLATEPGDWLTWLYLARLQEMLGQAQAGARSMEQAIACEIIPGETRHWLGVWRLHAGDTAGAVTALSGVLDLRPVRHGSMMMLGEALLRAGKVEAAEKAFARASLSPNPAFLQRLAQTVHGHNYWQEAIAVLRKSLALQPGDVPAWLALAKIQSEVYFLGDCRDSLQRIRSLQPDNPQAALLEAGLQGRMGDAKGHLATLQRAYRHGGDPLSRIASSIAMTALYQDDLPAADVADLHRALCAPIEAALPRTASFANERSTTRRLRIGYVTGDLHRQHPVNVFMLPVLLRHDHARFEICVYYTGAMHDAYTRQAMACADRWVEAAGLDDAALQARIVADGVDVLIDLAGHTSTHRLGVFAMRAAPVQATFLGYPHSTGLRSIDWIIGDATVTPAAHAALFSEGIGQLPHSVFCWAPVEDYPLPAARPAAAPVVFGSFNNAMKLCPKTIALWADVLAAVPGSRLLLKAPSLRDAAVQERFAGLFAARGVARERLQFRGPSGLADMMQQYGDIDIALDPTPYNGGTTTLQALWMGVPVVCLTGDNFVGRMGASFMRTLGRPEWVAEDAAGYVASATRLAAGIGALRDSREMLRAQMAASPLCDIQNYVAQMEALYGRMWKNHCDGAGARLLPAATTPQEAGRVEAGQAACS